MHRPIFDFEENVADTRMTVGVAIGQVSANHAFDDSFFIDILIL